MVRVLGNRRHRDIAIQALFVSVLVLIVVSAVAITRRNLAIQGVTVGWDFLSYSTGWTISYSFIPYSISDTYARALLVGFINTLFLGVVSISLAVVLGTSIGTARLSAHKLVNLIASTYVQIFRNIPLILQAFFWYTLITHLPPPRTALALPASIFVSNRGIFLPGINVEGLFLFLAAVVLVAGVVSAVGLSRKMSKGMGLATIVATAALVACILAIGKLPDLPMFDVPVIRGLRFTGGMIIVPELSAAVISIALFGAAYIAEIVRAGFLAVPHGLTEAGSALGLRPMQIFWRIRLPLMIRIILPTMTNQIIWLMKATTVGIVIGFTDFFGAISVAINNSGQTISLILILILGFWLINMTIAFVMNGINRALALPGFKK